LGSLALLRRDGAILPSLLDALRARPQDELSSLLAHVMVDAGSESATTVLTSLLLDAHRSLRPLTVSLRRPSASVDCVALLRCALRRARAR